MGIWGRRGKLRIFLRQQQLHCQYFSFCSKRVKSFRLCCSSIWIYSQSRPPPICPLLDVLLTHFFNRSCINVSINPFNFKETSFVINVFSLCYEIVDKIFSNISFFVVRSSGWSIKASLICSLLDAHLPPPTFPHTLLHLVFSTRPFNWVPFL